MVVTKVGARAPAAQRLGRRVMRISEVETSVERRRFRVRDEATRARLEGIGRAFLSGYHLALDTSGLVELDAALTEGHDPFHRGFAYEGAGMAISLLDAMTLPGRRGFARFADGPARPHTYLAHVGRGWAYARMRRVAAGPRGLHPLLGPLALDGSGFHAAYFAPERYVDAARPPRLRAASAAVFDQGVGRALWFVEGADPERIAHRIGRFAPVRRADLWSGVGLAASYAGGTGPDGLRLLQASAGPAAADLAQGAAFAAKARLASGTVVLETEAAVRVLCGMPVAEAAAVTDAAAVEVDLDRSAHPYSEWRGRIRAQLSALAQEASPCDLR